MNKRQKIMVEDFKKAILEEFPNLEKNIYVEEYERGIYCINVHFPDFTYGKVFSINCDLFEKSITIGHDKQDRIYLSYNQNTWNKTLNETVELISSMYLDLNSDDYKKWSIVNIESFWDTRYNNSEQILEIRFPGNCYYHYYNFSNTDLENLTKTEKPLVYFNKEIRNKYTYNKVFGY